MSKKSKFNKENKTYYFLLLEQYKLCIESAEKVSVRRANNNVFFISLNSSFIALIGIIYFRMSSDEPNNIITNIVVSLVGVLLIMLNWYWKQLIRSYQQLNSAKFKVIGQLEAELPKSPYYKMEWAELGKGKDKAKYIRLTDTEVKIPNIAIIAIIILLLFIWICWFLC